ncbi:hypothetical protein WJX72_005562 [[Myrmecia] bisecta]|uniref:Uncharacterized protein n=1 Tax=[Myrmecia] bisecta TaxID=41462 RepID=A0AAW1P2H5_9CHLO
MSTAWRKPVTQRGPAAAGSARAGVGVPTKQVQDWRAESTQIQAGKRLTRRTTVPQAPQTGRIAQTHTRTLYCLRRHQHLYLPARRNWTFTLAAAAVTTAWRRAKQAKRVAAAVKKPQAKAICNA